MSDFGEWNAKVKEQLVGCTIVEARYLTPEECNSSMWYKSGVIFWMQNKDKNLFQVTVLQDDEGNGPGVLEIVDVSNMDDPKQLSGAPSIYGVEGMVS